MMLFYMKLLYIIAVICVSAGERNLGTHRKQVLFQLKRDGNGNALEAYTSSQSLSYKYTSCIITRIRDVDYLLEEWFQYHIAIGVDRFIVADDCSSDDGKTMSILEKYERLGVLTLYRKNPHLDCDNFRPNSSLHMSYMFNREKDNCRWMTSIDPDEYLFPNHEAKTVKYLNSLLLSQNFPLIRMVGYTLFNRGDMVRTTEPLLHRYRFGRLQLFIKTFAMSRVVADWRSAHFPDIKNITWNGVPVGLNETEIFIQDVIDKTVFPNFCELPTSAIYFRHFRSMSWQDYQLRKARVYEATGQHNRFRNNTMRKWLMENSSVTCPLPGGVQYLPMVLATLYPGLNTATN